MATVGVIAGMGSGHTDSYHKTVFTVDSYPDDIQDELMIEDKTPYYRKFEKGKKKRNEKY